MTQKESLVNAIYLYILFIFLTSVVTVKKATKLLYVRAKKNTFLLLLSVFELVVT